jgi:pyruvate,water dikinase
MYNNSMWHDSYILWFADVDTHSPHSVGSHAKQLAKLTQAHFPIAPGFIITSKAYQTFLKETRLDDKIEKLLSTIAIERPESLMQGEFHIKQLFIESKLPEDIEDELRYFYNRLDADEITLSLHEKESKGRKHTHKHILNEDQFIEAVKDMWAEMFTSTALWHRHHRNLNHLETSAEIIVQEKITSDITGTVTTIEPTTHTKDKIVITTIHPHLGDRYLISKKNLSIIDRALAYETNLPKLTHDEILNIANMAKRLEEYLYFPQEITWAIDGENIYIIETKPISTLSKQPIEPKRKIPVARGKGLNSIISTGVITIVSSHVDLKRIKPHTILVISDANSKHLHYLKNVKGVITQSHTFPTEVAIQLKRYGIPAISNVQTNKLLDGHIITIHGGKGEIYLGGFL